MNSYRASAAPLRAALRCAVIAVLAFAAGCAGYSRKPLLEPDEYRRLLAERRIDSAETSAAMPKDGVRPDDGIALDEAELLCLFLNPRLRAARARAGVPAASAENAGLWDDPEFSADLLRILENPDHPWIAGASLSFTLPISGRLGAEKEHATAEARAALVGAWAEEQDVLRDLRNAWADWSAAHESAALVGDLLVRIDDVVSIVNRREELGETIAAEAVAFRLAQARARVELGDIAASERQARLRVLQLIGAVPDAAIELVAGRDASPTTELVEADAVFARNPSVLVTASAYETAERALRLEVRKQYPDLQIGPSYGREDGENRLGAGFSIPIPILNANRQGIAEADAARTAARAAWEAVVHEALADEARARLALDAARQRRSAVEETVVPLAARQIAEARRLADLGEVDALLLLEALRSEREAALDLIDANAEVARAGAALLAVVPPAPPALPAVGEKGDDR